MDHFESVAAVNKWTAFRRLPDDVKVDYGTCVEALQRRFNPDSKRQLYMVELNARTKRRDEDWAAFGDAVRVLADKAYPELAENARERLALYQFLEQIKNSQVAFSAKQKRPRNVEEAAAAVIELESYLRSTGKPSRVNAVSSQEQEPETHHTVPARGTSLSGHFARRARLVNSHHEITVRETAASGGAYRRKRTVRNPWGKTIDNRSILCDGV
eukprot:Em0009g896a